MNTLDIQHVVLVDESNVEIGSMEKLRAHTRPVSLHRALSVVLWRKSDSGDIELLLQQRGKDKPLWPRHWTNTVCTHPHPRESYLDCATRRLSEEMGISIDPAHLSVLYQFVYHAQYDETLSEHEHDTVVVGEWRGGVQPVEGEAMGYRWVSVRIVQSELAEHPDVYTPWFQLIMKDQRFLTYIKELA